MTLVAIHQPPYFPWLGLLEKIALCDRFVVLDNVQYNARAFQHRTLYSTPRGAAYMSLSVRAKGHQVNHTQIRDIELADPARPKKHFETLRHRYGKRPGWRLVSADMERILCGTSTRLLEFNLPLIALTMRAFQLATEVVLASSLPSTGHKSALMLSLVRAAGGHAYLSGAGSRTYIDATAFSEADITLYWQDFKHPIYAQSHGGQFQAGCFALEWFIEEPDEAPAKFRAHVKAAAQKAGIPR